MNKVYTIKRSSLRIAKIEKKMNEMGKDGWRYEDMVQGKFLIFFSRMYIIFSK